MIKQIVKTLDGNEVRPTWPITLPKSHYLPDHPVVSDG